MAIEYVGFPCRPGICGGTTTISGGCWGTEDRWWQRVPQPAQEQRTAAIARMLTGSRAALCSRPVLPVGAAGVALNSRALSTGLCISIDDSARLSVQIAAIQKEERKA